LRRRLYQCAHEFAPEKYSMADARDGRKLRKDLRKAMLVFEAEVIARWRTQDYL
jgi:hypothetical protein